MAFFGQNATGISHPTDTSLTVEEGHFENENLSRSSDLGKFDFSKPSEIVEEDRWMLIFLDFACEGVERFGSKNEERRWRGIS